jgi:hypothetical protein
VLASVYLTPPGWWLAREYEAPRPAASATMATAVVAHRRVVCLEV